MPLKRKKKFLRTSMHQFNRLGSNKKKLRKWRRPRGRHSKVREHIRGKMAEPVIGFRTARNIRGTIRGKIPILIKNLKELENVGKESLIIIAKIGRKKRQELEKKAQEKGVEIFNKKKTEKNTENKNPEGIFNPPNGDGKQNPFGGNQRFSAPQTSMKEKQEVKGEEEKK